MNIGLLEHGCQRLLDRAPRLKKRGEAGAGAQARDTQLNAARTGLPVPIAVAVALRQPLAAFLAILGAGLGTDLQFHQPLGGKRRPHGRPSRASQVGITALLDERAEVHHRFGHRVYPSVQVGVSNPTLPRNPMATDTYTTLRDVTWRCGYSPFHRVDLSRCLLP